jgi:hypothetical protein
MSLRDALAVLVSHFDADQHRERHAAAMDLIADEEKKASARSATKPFAEAAARSRRQATNSVGTPEPVDARAGSVGN